MKKNNYIRILALTVGIVTLCCMTFGGELYAQTNNYRYKIEYDFMGLKKTAAHADVSIRIDGENFAGSLNGHSIEWGGRYYTVSDTLVARMFHTNGHLTVREEVVFKIGWYSKPTAAQAADGMYVFNNPKLYKNTDGMGLLDASEETMEAVSITTDMLAMFYSYRKINFDRILPGREYLVSITGSNGERQHLLFRYVGVSRYKINGVEYPTYQTQFEYYFNGRPSGYTVSCEVEQQSRLPLVFSGKLKIGEVAMIYEP